MFSIFFTICVTITIILTIIAKWYLAKGILKIVHYLSIVTCLVYITMNTGVAIFRPEMAATALYSFLSSYIIAMDIKGLLRLKKESTVTRRIT